MFLALPPVAALLVNACHDPVLTSSVSDIREVHAKNIEAYALCTRVPVRRAAAARVYRRL